MLLYVYMYYTNVFVPYLNVWQAMMFCAMCLFELIKKCLILSYLIPSGNPLGFLRRDYHAVKRRVIASSHRGGKPWLIKTVYRAEDALQPWSADRLQEGNSDKKTNAEAGCTEPMAHKGSATQPRLMAGDEREEEDPAC